MSKRKNYAPAFKVKVALEAIRGDKTLPELSQIYEIHPNLIGNRKKEALDYFQGIFSGEIKSQEKTDKVKSTSSSSYISKRGISFSL